MIKTSFVVLNGLFILSGLFHISTAEAAEAHSQEATLNDGQILQFTHFANAGEIAQAKLARTKTASAAVKKFAEMMITDHGEADKRGAAIAKTDKLTLTTSSESADLKSDADRNTDVLRAREGLDFAKEYVDVQVKEHQAVLDALDKKLIPAATRADVKVYLKAVREKVAAHLAHALDLQATLAKST